MVFFLALRNIIRNKKDSAIVVILIAIITFLFFIGNSVIGKADSSIRRGFIESLTGDVTLQASGEITMSLFGANAPVIDEFFTIPILPAYNALMELVSAEPGIAGISSQVSGRAFLDLLDVREPVLLCGIDAGSYFSLFPGIVLEEGRFLRAGEFGAMITEERAQRIQAQSGQRPHIGMPLLLTSGGATGFRIREVPLVGIFRYQNPGQFMNEIVIIDSHTVRELNAIQAASFVDPGEIPLDLLRADIDDIFGGPFAAAEVTEAGFTADLLQNFLSEPRADIIDMEMGGDWNFIILRLNRGVSAPAFISSLNRKIEPFGVTAVNWRIAAGASAILTLLLQALFNSGIFIVSVVGIIAIINILLISVFRRVREIGTLRAIGASDRYIRSLIYCESLLVSLFAGFAGVLGGALFLRWVNILDIPITNELMVSILNGPVLRLEFLPHVAIFSFGLAVLLGLVAAVYPVEAAARLQPMAALRQG